jgi:hypothetical protein
MIVEDFRIQGFRDHEDVTLKASQLYEILLRPFGPAKMAVLRALSLFGFLSTQRTHFGLPLGGSVVPIAMVTTDVGGTGKAPIVLGATISLNEGDFDGIGLRPSSVPLDRITVAFELGGLGRGTSGFSVTKFETSNGRDYASPGTNSFVEARDVALGVALSGEAMKGLLATARVTRGGTWDALPEQAFEGHERSALELVLELVGTYEAKYGGMCPRREIILSVPPEEVASVDLALDELVAKRYLGVASGAFFLTPLGLSRCSIWERAATLVEELLSYITWRTTSERSSFIFYTWDDLLAANVVGSDDQALARMTISSLHLGEEGALRGGIAWNVPDDIVELRSIASFRELLARAERLREPEVGAIITAAS